ncbi:MAG: tRNA 4-thiouridine(8) synthase ThiI [Desulfobacterales bacterium]
MHATKIKNKAVGLLSGGLDSTLAAKLMLEQGVEVFAVNFTSPFCTCTPKKAGCAAVATAVRGLGGVSLKQIALRDEYLYMVKDPKHGYGSQMNPCIDCRIMKIVKAGQYMQKIGADFMFTGEVLGQRPMSQHKHAMEMIATKSGFREYLLRPLSAAYFEPTVPERRGWVDRNKLLAITGRSRKTQISLAAEKGIHDYPCPAGGCLLTDKSFSERIRDYFMFTNKPSMGDIQLLKTGRHFRLESGDKVIVARNENECKMLKNLWKRSDHLFIPLDFSGPTVILQGSDLKTALGKLTEYTRSPVRDTARVTHRHGVEENTIFIDAF